MGNICNCIKPSSNISSTSSDARKRIISLSKRATFLSTYRRQEWSLPDSIIYYITKNPSSPKCYQKMIKSCKYFFIQNPILIVRDYTLKYKNNHWHANHNTIYEWHIELEELQEHIDLNKILSKIWITQSLFIYHSDRSDSNLHSSTILPKFFQCDIKNLDIHQQNIYFNDLKFIASNVVKVVFVNAVVTNEDDSVVPLKNIIKVIPKIEDFILWVFRQL